MFSFNKEEPDNMAWTWPKYFDPFSEIIVLFSQAFGVIWCHVAIF
jgi:hypothetical protein